MFALIENGAISNVVEVIPDAPIPLPSGYIAPDYRMVVDGQIPSRTHPFSDIVPLPKASWTITPSRVVRAWIEVIPSMIDSQRAKERELARAANESISTGITVTLAPYGPLTFAADAVTDLLVCAYLCDLEIRNGGKPAADMLRPLMLADGSLVEVKCGDALKIIHSFLTQHRTRHLAHATKLRAVRLATTTAELEAIT